MGFRSSLLASKSSLLGLCTVFLKRGLRPLYFLNRLFVGRGVLVGVEIFAVGSEVFAVGALQRIS